MHPVTWLCLRVRRLCIIAHDAGDSHNCRRARIRSLPSNGSFSCSGMAATGSGAGSSCCRYVSLLVVVPVTCKSVSCMIAGMCPCTVRMPASTRQYSPVHRLTLKFDSWRRR